jgi:hypothetical protein
MGLRIAAAGRADHAYNSERSVQSGLVRRVPNGESGHLATIETSNTDTLGCNEKCNKGLNRIQKSHHNVRSRYRPRFICLGDAPRDWELYRVKGASLTSKPRMGGKETHQMPINTSATNSMVFLEEYST